jgi:WXG100 family type VII secretion target
MGNGRIQLSYAQLEEATAEIARQSGSMNGTLEDLRSQLDNLDWDGEDKVSYEEAKLQWDQAFTKINDILDAVGRSVDNAKNRYQETEAANASRFA